MKTAILLIPSNLNEKVHKGEYLKLCINKAMEEGYMPLTPDLYEIFTNTLREVYIDMYFPYADTVILFADYALDQAMLDIIDRCIKARKDYQVKRLVEMDLLNCYSTPVQILHEVARMTNTPVDQLAGRSRKREIVDARYVYCRRAKEKTKASLSQIGMLIRRDHASVLHGINEANNTQDIINLYEKCYGTNKSKATPLGKERYIYPANGEQEERSVLSYIEMEKGEPGVPEKKSVMPEMRAKGFYAAIGSY